MPATDGEDKFTMRKAATTVPQVQRRSERVTAFPKPENAVETMATALLPAVAPLLLEAAAAMLIPAAAVTPLPSVAAMLPAIAATLLPSAAPMPVVAVASVILPTAMAAIGGLTAITHDVTRATAASAEESTVLSGNRAVMSNTRKLLSDAVLLNATDATVAVTDATPEAANDGTLTINAPMADTVNAVPRVCTTGFMFLPTHALIIAACSHGGPNFPSAQPV